MDDVRERLRPEGFDIADLDAAQTTGYLRSETRRWQPIAKSSSARNRWCRVKESNPRPSHYKCAALPSELTRHAV